MREKKVGALCWLLVLLAAPRAGADAVVYTTQTPVGGLKGEVVDRPTTEPYACGIVWEQSEQAIWGTGLDISGGYPGVPDLVLAFNPDKAWDEVRVARDTGAVVIGPGIGHPNSGFQLELEPSHMSGLLVGTDGYGYSAYFYNHNAPKNNRTCVNFENLWAWATDRWEHGGTDYSLYDMSTGLPVLSFDSGSKMSFYGAPAVSQPAVSGSWSDGSAQKSLLAALVSLGLVRDATQP